MSLGLYVILFKKVYNFNCFCRWYGFFVVLVTSFLNKLQKRPLLFVAMDCIVFKLEMLHRFAHIQTGHQNVVRRYSCYINVSSETALQSIYRIFIGILIGQYSQSVVRFCWRGYNGIKQFLYLYWKWLIVRVVYSVVVRPPAIREVCQNSIESCLERRVSCCRVWGLRLCMYYNTEWFY